MIATPVLTAATGVDMMVAVVVDLNLLLLPCWPFCSMNGMVSNIQRVNKQRIAAIEGSLTKLLRSGVLRLVSVDWLLSQPADWVALRRQDLPAEAFLVPEVAVKALESRSVAAMSYRWLSREHPDPHAFHLDKLRKALRTLNRTSIPDHRDGGSGGGESCGGAASCSGAVGGGSGEGSRADGASRYYSALFMDFLCCPQRDAEGKKTEAEVAVFKHCLGAMGAVYASPRTLVLQEKQMPREDIAAGTVSYDGSGWCSFEQAVARLCHRGESAKVLEIGVQGCEEGEALLARMSPDWAHYELPSMDEMDDLFLNEARTYFFGKSDRQLVARMYREFAEKVVEWEWENMPFCIKAGETRTQRQFSYCRRHLMLLAFVSVASTCVSIWMASAAAPPVVPFACWVLVLAIWALLFGYHQSLLCVAPTYRIRWRSCLTRALRCDGLGNGADPADLKRSVVYERGRVAHVVR